MNKREEAIIAALDPLINAAMRHAANEDNEYHDAFVAAKRFAVAQLHADFRRLILLAGFAGADWFDAFRSNIDSCIGHAEEVIAGLEDGPAAYAQFAKEFTEAILNWGERE